MTIIGYEPTKDRQYFAVLFVMSTRSIKCICTRESVDALLWTAMTWRFSITSWYRIIDSLIHSACRSQYSVYDLCVIALYCLCRLILCICAWINRPTMKECFVIVVMLSRPIIDTFPISIFISFLDNVGNEFKVIPVGLTVFNRCFKKFWFSAELLSFTALCSFGDMLFI